MTAIKNKLVLVDFEIERTLLKKKHLDSYLVELYKMREYLLVEIESQEQKCTGCNYD